MTVGLLFAAALAAPVRSPPEVSPPRPPSAFETSQFRLEGGAEVWLVERHEIPLVGVRLEVEWGSALTPLEEQLAAGLVNVLLESGSRELDGAALSAAMEHLGATWDLGMNGSTIWAEVVVPTGGEEEALALLSEALFSVNWSNSEVRRITRRWATWREHLALDLDLIHERGVNHAWYPDGHPSRHTATATEIKKLRASNARDLASQVLEEGKAGITVVGDVHPETMLPLLETHFGRLSGQVRGSRLPPVEPEPRLVLVDRPGFQVARVSVMWPGPSFDDPMLPTVETLMSLLARDSISRLGRELREERGISYGVSGEVEAWRGSGRLRIDCDVDPARLGEALLTMSQTLGDIDEAEFTEEEVKRATRTLLLELGRAQETTQETLEQVAELRRLGLGADHHTAQGQVLRWISAGQVSDVAEDWLGTEQWVWVVTGDRNVIEPQLEAVEWIPDRIVSARVLSNER